LSFAIVINVKGAELTADKIRKVKIGIVARLAKMLSLIGEEIVGISREDYLSGPRPEHLGRRSGDLARSVNYRVSGNRVVVGTNLIDGPVHEFGATIYPKSKPRLVFQLLDKSWRSALKVVIPERPFLRPALRDSIRPSIGIVQRLTKEAVREAMA
jgi:phage gpG-like protein